MLDNLNRDRDCWTTKVKEWKERRTELRRSRKGLQKGQDDIPSQAIPGHPSCGAPQRKGDDFIPMAGGSASIWIEVSRPPSISFNARTAGYLHPPSVFGSHK